MGHEDDITKLKNLILSKELSELKELKEKIDKPHNFSKQVAGVLPEAFKRANSESDGISKSMVPTIEKTILKSVSGNPKPMADALFPIMGPAIRKSISEALKSLFQSINKTIENSLSWQGLKWRLEALVTQKSYAEIVLAKSLVFRVREVFFIHTDTGLLLKHVVSEGVKTDEADMVSSMLKAIQDFVADSFVKNGESLLGTVEVGDLQIWIEQGPKAILATVLEGHPPEKFRIKLREANESLHMSFSPELSEFNGDTVVFDPAEEELNDLMVSQFKPRKKSKGYFWGWASIIFILILITALIYAGYRKKARFSQYITTVKQIPGVIITHSEKHNRNYIVEGLKDPDAEHPASLLGAFKIDSTKVRYNFKPYLSTGNDLILKRLHKQVDPPSTISFSISDGVLMARGSSPMKWVNENRGIIKSMPGIKDVDFSGVFYEEENTVKELITEIASIRISFEVGQWQLNSKEYANLDELKAKLDTLLKTGEVLNEEFTIRLEGYSDPTGDASYNAYLSSRRAEQIKSRLARMGISENKIEVEGMGIAADVEQQRKVIVKIIRNSND